MNCHEHRCNHKHVEFCQGCKKVYCKDCKMSWQEECKLNHTTYWPTYPTTTYLTTISGTDITCNDHN